MTNTDTSRDVQAIYDEMRKLGVTAGTTAELSLHDVSGPDGATDSGNHQASDVMETDHQPETGTDDNAAALDRLVLLPAHTSTYSHSHLSNSFYLSLLCIYLGLCVIA